MVRLLSGPFSALKEMQQKPPQCDELLGTVVKLLDKKKPTGILVAMGQGSFTGVRCAVTIGNALAYGWGVPIVGLDISKFRNEKALVERGVKQLELLLKKPQPPRSLHAVYGGTPNITQPKNNSSAPQLVRRNKAQGQKKKQKVVEEVSAGGVVVHRGKVLVIRFVGSRQWVFPKGHIDPGENAAAAAQREVHEETGFRVRVGKPLDIEHYTYRHPDGAQIRKKVYYFSCALLSEKRQPIAGDPDEKFIVQWMPVAVAMRKLAYPSLRVLLKKTVGT